MRLSNPAKLIISLSIPLAAGLIGSLFTMPVIDTWYASLNKPFFNPPSWIFAPVWTILYIMMGIAAFLVWKKSAWGWKDNQIAVALLIFDIQLMLNLLWSVLFFAWGSPFFAFLEILLLLFFILFTIIKFKKIDIRAAYLMIPYLVWVMFATVLNYGIWVLN